MVWQMFKPFVREKLRKRMFFHGTKMSSLHNHVAPSHLPTNYGGQLPEIDYTSADWYPTILQYEDRIKGNTFINQRENMCFRLPHINHDVYRYTMVIFIKYFLFNLIENFSSINQAFKFYFFRMEFIWVSKK